MPTIKWNTVSPEDIELYHSNTNNCLSKVYVNRSRILCVNINCKDDAHMAAIDHMYKEVVEAMKDSSECILYLILS